MRPDTVLVVGYGNELRGDDAAGPRAADRVASWRLPGVEVRALHQLVPELAEALAAASRAIFLDAHPLSECPAVRVRRIQPTHTGSGFAHTGQPHDLLALSRTAFGRWPDAWWVTIPAADFTLGAPLSPVAERGVADALLALRQLTDPRASATDAAGNARDALPAT
jgi:hydrogenase maturation protease